MVEGFPPIQEPTSSCESCILEKQHMDSFPRGVSYREKAPLELVHTDLCGPMQTQSLGGSYYFLTFIDDYNRKTWVYFLAKKS
jgi:hypothetical protein